MSGLFLGMSELQRLEH